MQQPQEAGSRVLFPTPRLAHLGAGGLIKVEIAFFSYSREKGIEGEEGGLGRMETALASIIESTPNVQPVDSELSHDIRDTESREWQAQWPL